MKGIYKGPRIAVEIDPPEKGAGKSEFLIDSANALKQAGADAVTIADNPTSRVRADSVVMASRVWRETGIKVIPHLTCRDRTREGLQSALLALDAEGLSTVLAVTGDPVSAEKRSSPVQSHFPARWSSIQLASAISEWNVSSFEKPMTVCGALNVNAVNFRAELARALKKKAAGMSVFMSQPVSTSRALDNLYLARETLGCTVLAGILPIVSAKNALFLSSAKIRGISIDQHIVKTFENAPREDWTQLGISLASEQATKALDACDGIYLITPFCRVDISTAIVRALRAEQNIPTSEPTFDHIETKAG